MAELAIDAPELESRFGSAIEATANSVTAERSMISRALSGVVLTRAASTEGKSSCADAE